MRIKNNQLINYPWGNLFINIQPLCRPDVSWLLENVVPLWHILPISPLDRVSSGSPFVLIMTVSKGTELVGGCPAEQKNRNCSLCHRRLSRITDRCVFPTESQRECPKAGRGWVKGALCFENPPDRWPPLHFRTMTLKLFYDHGPSGRSINQNTTYPGPWARAEWPVLLPLGEFIQYPWASISTSGKSGVRSDDLEFVPSLKPCISYHSSAFLFWRKTMWPAPLRPEWRIWHHFDGTQMREMVKHELMLKIKLCTVPSWSHSRRAACSSCDVTASHIRFLSHHL